MSIYFDFGLVERLRRALLNAGFSSAEVYGGWDLRAYDENLQTMLIVARKQ